jgi:DNA-binding CsgD family transcriptional regulator
MPGLLTQLPARPAVTGHGQQRADIPERCQTRPGLGEHRRESRARPEDPSPTATDAASWLTASSTRDFVKPHADAPHQISLKPKHVSGRGVAAGDYGLTPREDLILKLMACGASNSDIGGELGLEIRTIKHHTSSILRKLGVRNRCEAVALAYRQGLVV